VDDWLAVLPERIAADTVAVNVLATKLSAFAEGATLAELNADLLEDAQLPQAILDSFRAELAAACADTATTKVIAATLEACSLARSAIAAAEMTEHESQVALQAELDALALQLKATVKVMEARHKQWLKLLETAEKSLRARLSIAFDSKAIREVKRALLAADTKKDEVPTMRDAVLKAFKQAVYFIHQGHWLHSRFPSGTFSNVPGLCRAVPIEGENSIAANDYSLTPGRYVGMASTTAEDEEDFVEKLREIHDELGELNDKAVEMAVRVSRNLEELLR
jgi:type I restriction enzyme M protein